LKLTVSTIAILIFTALATQAHPAAAAATPAWCSALGSNRVDFSGDIKAATDEPDPRNALKELVGRLCKPDAESTAHLSDLEAARQKWSQRLDLADADWADVADYATLGQGERMAGSVQLNTHGQTLGIGDTLKLAWSSYDALNQYARIRSDTGRSGDLALDHNYFVDALGARLTELGRFAYVRWCLESTRPVQWAMCQGDVAQLDLKKVATELRANKVYSGADKTRVRIEVDAFKPVLAAQPAKVKDLVSRDPAYGQLFDAGAAARKEWAARARTDAALLDLVAAMDDARATNSRRAAAGCEDKTWAAWKGAVAALPAKTFDGMHDDRENAQTFLDLAMAPLLNNPRVYLASVALTTCVALSQERNAPVDVLLRTLNRRMVRWPGTRGPRTATETAIMTAGVTLDDRDAKLEYPEANRDVSGGGGNGGARQGSGSGVVASVSPSGKTVKLEFKKQMAKGTICTEFKDTNHIEQIRDDGQIQYRRICLKSKAVTFDKADPPQTVVPRYAEGVKPGMFASVIEDVVTAAWTKQDAPVPSVVFGVAVK
jgi:hypothetical protein